MEHKRFFLISADAMVYEDLEYASSLPAFRYLLENGSMVKRVRSIYPTLTYPCHTTMLSGCWPDKHGITNNTVDLAGIRNLPWNFYHDDVRVADLMDVCKAAGYTTGSVGWPVSGRHKSIDYLVDEIWSVPQINDLDTAVRDLRRLLLDAGTSEEVLRSCAEEYLPLRVFKKMPDTAWFSTKTCTEMIRRYKPEVLTLHIGQIDRYRHLYGVFGPHIRKGLDETNEMLLTLFDALKEAGVWEKTNIVLTADHGQINTDRSVNVNVLLREAGLIRTDVADKVLDWDAWCFSCGASAQVALRDPADHGLYQKVYDLLYARLKQGDAGYSVIYEKDEFRKEHLDGNFSFVLETDGHSAFGVDWMGAYFVPKVMGKHGYHPDKAPRPTIICCGPDFRKGVTLEGANLVDGAPTWASLLGLKLPDGDGRVLKELIAI